MRHAFLFYSRRYSAMIHLPRHECEQRAPIRPPMEVGPRLPGINPSHLLPALADKAYIPDEFLGKILLQHIFVPRQPLEHLQPLVFAPVVYFEGNRHAVAVEVELQFHASHLRVVEHPHLPPPAQVGLHLAVSGKTLPKLSFQLLQFVFLIHFTL